MERIIVVAPPCGSRGCMADNHRWPLSPRHRAVAYVESVGASHMRLTPRCISRSRYCLESAFGKTGYSAGRGVG